MRRIKLTVIFFSLIASLSACTSNQKHRETKVSEATSSIEVSTNNEPFEHEPNSLRLDNYFKDLLIDEQNPKIIFEKTYDVDWRDNEWSDVDFSIDKVKVVEVDSFELNNDQKYRGIIAVHYDLKNDSKQDVSIYPEKANVVLTDNKMLEAVLYLERWDNVFSVNKYTDGLIYFLLADVENLVNAKELELHFNVKSRSDNSLDKRTYQVRLPLTLSNE